jgi:hypothetical protein
MFGSGFPMVPNGPNAHGFFRLIYIEREKKEMHASRYIIYGVRFGPPPPYIYGDIDAVSDLNLISRYKSAIW